MVTPKGADLIAIKKDRFLNPVENFFFFWLRQMQFPAQGSNLCPLQSKRGVSTTGPPGGSHTIANLRERGGTVKGGRAVVKPPTTWPRWTCGRSHPVLFPESSVTAGLQAARVVQLSWEQIWPESLSAPCFEGLFPDCSQNGPPQRHCLHFSLPYLQTSQVAAPEGLPSPPCFVPTAPDCHCPFAWLHSRICYR